MNLSANNVKTVITPRLRALAREEHTARIPPEKLYAEHHRILTRAINNVLSIDLALFTYAQIIDGLPTADVGWDRRSPGLWGDHPLDQHEELCPGAMDKARELCQKWTPTMLAFKPELLNAFRRAAFGSKVFETRLVELVAVALHQFGVLLFQLDLRLHQGDVDSIVRWTMPRPPTATGVWVDVPARPTIFNHPAYLDVDIYPEGVADIVGYWVEDRILAGSGYGVR